MNIMVSNRIKRYGLIALVISGIGGLVALDEYVVSRKRERIQAFYDVLPVGDVVRNYDVNNDGKLNRTEQAKLFNDYNLIQKE